MATVIDAAQRKAQIEQQAQTGANQQLIEGLQSIGQVGQSLVDKRMKVAQALALGKQFDIPDNIAKGMDPDQILKVGAIKKGNIDMPMLMNLLHPGFAPNIAGANPGAVPPAGTPPPAASSGTVPSGAMLASDTTTTPLSPTAPAPAPVPIPVPSANPDVAPMAAPPRSINGATANMAYKMAMATKPDNVYSYDNNGNLTHVGQVPKGSKIEKDLIPKGSGSAGGQDKLEKQYRDLLTKNISMRSGGLGLEDSKVNQAIHLRRLANQSYDPATGNYNIPKTYYSELINGLATLTSPNGRPGIEVMHELQQRTAKGDLGGALGYLGFTDSNGNPPVGSTQSVLKMLVDSIDRQGDQAEQNRQGYLDQIHGLAPTELDPARIEKMNKANIGNSYNAFLAKSPDKQTTQGSGSEWNSSSEQRLQMLLEKKAKGTLKS